MSTLIKNGTVYDGTGQPPSEQDILVKGKFIAGVGNYNNDDADKVIDARGKLVCPGFIDVNSSSDHHLSLLSDPYQREVVKQGITTIVGGNAGLSLAPLSGGVDELLGFSGAGSLDFNIDWEDFSEYLDILQDRGCGVNFGSFVGYYTLKDLVAEERDKKLQDEELEVLRDEVKKAIKGGAFGISFGLDVPSGAYVESDEIKDIALLIKEEEGLVSTSIRSPESRVEESIDEILKIAKESECNMEINQLQPTKSKSGEYKKAKKNIEEAAKTDRINFDCHPYPLIKLPLYWLLPEDVRQDSFQDMVEYVKDEENDNAIIEKLKSRTRKTIRILHMPSEFRFFEGKTIKELSDSFELTQVESLLRILRLTELRGMVLFGDVNKKALDAFLSSEASIVASNGIHLEASQYTPFSELMSWADKNDFPVEKAVAKMTSIPAKKYGIEKRGLIKDGNRADLVVLDINEVSDVFVNGNLVLENKEHKEILAGNILRKN